MAYSNEELTLRVKRLEQIVMELTDDPKNTYGRGHICRNASLHTGTDPVEHPRELEVPHYTVQWPINWDRNIIDLGVLERRFVKFQDRDYA